jgi:hypothetical protein
MEINSKQLKMGIAVEKEHLKTITGDKKEKTRKIALDHLKEIPDYYTRLKKMEKKAGVKEAWVDPIEVLHRANRARILKGAKEGKYWIIRSESVDENKKFRDKIRRQGGSGPTGASGSIGNTGGSGGCGGSSMPNGRIRESDREELINKIIETTTSGAIGGFNMPMAGNKDDPAFGGRNRFAKQQLRFAVNRLLGKSVKPPTV